MSWIEGVVAREILDSRGNPTIEAEVTLVGGEVGRAAVPSGASTGEHEAVEWRAGSFSESLRIGTEIFHILKSVLKKKGYVTSVGDEGGFAPNLRSNEEAIETILEAIAQAGYASGKDCLLALDPAASEFYDGKSYVFKNSDNRDLSSEQMVQCWKAWTGTYPIISIEDGMAENDVTGLKSLTDELGRRVQLVGDDLFFSNTEFLLKGI